MVSLTLHQRPHFFNFEQISRIVLVIPLSTLNRSPLAGTGIRGGFSIGLNEEYQ